MDKYKLLYEMNKKGVSTQEICAKISISRSAWYRKLNGTSDFTQSEIQGIVDYLDLDTPVGIFFTNKVS